MKIIGSFPKIRLRRLRKSKWIRDLVSETTLSNNDLILPIFIREGKNKIDSIKSMPDVKRYTVDKLSIILRLVKKYNIPAVALFPYTPENKKDKKGSEALNPNNLVCRSIRYIKEKFPTIGIMTDVALDPYTSHGHDGIIIDNKINNDETIKILVKQALLQAKMGCDIIAPSDMMDGRIKIIRDALEQNDFINTLILAYSAKFSSKFYGPFKDAVESAKFFGDKTKDTYQMPIQNINEALHEVALDIQEGADIVMVKPGMPYLDVIKAVKDEFKMPTFAYQVSGEYSMIKTSIETGLLSNDVIKESLLSFKRAGADCILTYFATEIARDLS